MNDLCVDIGYRSVIKYGEELCGDCVKAERIKKNDTMIMVLADGLGSGVKANILSTLTAQILSTMMSASMSIDECVETMAATLPVCSKRGVAYSTFTIICIKDNKRAEIIQYDNPMVIMLRNGKSYDYPKTMREIDGKKIYETYIDVEQDDVFVAMSDGAIYAGVGQVLNYGWQRENIVAYLESRYNVKMTAKIITSLILDECSRLYDFKPGDDTTIATVQIRKRKLANLVIGPPLNKKDDEEMMKEFFALDGRHIICGGTTSHIAAKYLGKELVASVDYLDPSIPPTASIDGVDLVTEGVITLSRVLDYAQDYVEQNDYYEIWDNKNDGASQIARMLFKEATDINFFVGQAVNPAHQNPDLPINFNIKRQIIRDLAECLKRMGKRIHVTYF